MTPKPRISSLWTRTSTRGAKVKFHAFTRISLGSYKTKLRTTGKMHILNLNPNAKKKRVLEPPPHRHSKIIKIRQEEAIL